MRLGIILSSGGSAFAAAARIASTRNIDFIVLTDRECSGEAAARHVGAEVIRILDRNRESYSVKARDTLSSLGAAGVLLFFDRLVSADLFDAMPTYNIHPSALPAFPGLTGVKDAYVHGARLLGCSLHRVDRTIDGGTLLAQIARGMDPNWPIERWQKAAYLMKTYLALVWIDRMSSGSCAAAPPINASHGLPECFIKGFRDLQQLEKMEVVDNGPYAK